MNREELFAEIDALRLDIADPHFPRNYKNAAQARIQEIFQILYPEPAIELEEDISAMSVAPEVSFDELFA